MATSHERRRPGDRTHAQNKTLRTLIAAEPGNLSDGATPGYFAAIESVLVVGNRGPLGLLVRKPGIVATKAFQ